jgi:hypothetical protein
MDRRTDGRTDRHGETSIPPYNFVVGGIIIEHVFHCITHFSCQILSFIHTFVLHTDRLEVDAHYISELGFFSLEILGAKGGADYASMRLIEDRL